MSRIGSFQEGRVGEKIGNGDRVGIINGDVDPAPQHLVILVNGIIGSAEDWKFAAERFRQRLSNQVAIHCSTSNAALQTFHGVDVMGKRLAEEVREVIDKTPGVSRISFVGHSLGGLVARYAVAQLYAANEGSEGNAIPDRMSKSFRNSRSYCGPTIGGLQPVNFITVATPHLGCSSSQQLPFLFGIEVLEKTAPYMAHWFVGRTGKHLFLSDGSNSEPPLLRRMVTDSEEGKFLSSLRVFETRTAYANVVNDQMVGWRTASIRRQSEMPQRDCECYSLNGTFLDARGRLATSNPLTVSIDHKPLDGKYPHIVREEPSLSSSQKLNSSVVVKQPVALSGKSPVCDPIEEEIINALNTMPWNRVDVSFHGAKPSYQAHNIIQVKNPKVHSEGADVIEHIIDKHFTSAMMQSQWSNLRECGYRALLF